MRKAKGSKKKVKRTTTASKRLAQPSQLFDRIKQGIDRLSPQEYFKLLEWLHVDVENDDNWDRQMKADAAAGRLDFLRDEADKALRGGRCKGFPWDM